MDARAFDVLTRSFVASRRRTMTVLFAGIVSGLLGGREEEAAAACGKIGYTCPANTKCCAGALCVDGLCRCRRGLKACDGTCTDLTSDEANCGGCGLACGPNEVCLDSLCKRDATF